MSKTRRKKSGGPRLKIDGQFIPHQIAMMRVLRGLSLPARRILDTLEIEHCRRGGRENGKLAASYDLIQRTCRISRRLISPALRELVAADLLKIVRRGRRAYGDLRVPSLYRLTYLPTLQNGSWVPPTHEWKQNTGAKWDTGTGAKWDTGPGAKNDILEQFPGAKRDTPILDLGVEGGGAPDGQSIPSPAEPLLSPEGAGPCAPSPPSDADDLPQVTAPSSGRLH